MDNYHLEPDEAVLTECENTTLEEGKLLNASGTLILTSKNLIWLTKNMFGKTKSVQKYPLTDIKIFNNEAQVKLDEKIGEYFLLSVFFKTAQLRFRLMERKKARELLNNINKLVTGSEDDLVAAEAIPGVEFIANAIKDTASTFMKAFGIKVNQPEPVTAKCGNCGAPISGLSGQVVKCPYCDTNTKL